MISKIISELESLGSSERAKHSLRFFKTGQGQYGEGDIFYGASVPETRNIAKKYKNISLDDVQKLLKNKHHECRLCALMILIEKYNYADKNDDSKTKKIIYEMYLDNTKYINNWDLVDLSAHKIVGAYLYDKKNERKILYELAKSNDLWKKRIGIISTYYFIYRKDFTDTLKISEILLLDNHDLIQKAVGWMLREVGKRDQKIEEEFLEKHHKIMPRTMLRYAIERFDDNKKKYYMKK
ncbi:MAG: DNA alkylation repair protein [Candidatus Woesearchaeota archaeon]